MSEQAKPTFMSFVLDRIKIHVVGAAILFTSSTLVVWLTPVGQHVKSIWNSPQHLENISDKVDTLITEVMKATGEDRVLVELPGLSYVVEPVYRGNAITLNMVVRRTKTGAGCVSIMRTPLFTDETNTAIAGISAPPANQIGSSETPVRIDLAVPPQVRSGRVTVYLSYEFECGENRIFETTRPVPFILKDR